MVPTLNSPEVKLMYSAHAPIPANPFKFLSGHSIPHAGGIPNICPLPRFYPGSYQGIRMKNDLSIAHMSRFPRDLHLPPPLGNYLPPQAPS